MRNLFILAFTLLISFPISSEATPLNSWSTSCSVEKGAITKRRGVYTFTTSKNLCSGGTYGQRAEITSKKISPNTKGAYLFETNVAMTSDSNEKFDIFQIHDGRDGCAPPLKVQVGKTGRIRLQSAVKLGPGEQCRPETRTDGSSEIRLLRDGTEYQLRILIQFNGNGEFETTVWLNGEHVVNGYYERPTIPGAFMSENFYFKHGVYSKNMFEYEMTSRKLVVKKVKAR